MQPQPQENKTFLCSTSCISNIVIHCYAFSYAIGYVIDYAIGFVIGYAIGYEISYAIGYAFSYAIGYGIGYDSGSVFYYDISKDIDFDIDYCKRSAFCYNIGQLFHCLWLWIWQGNAIIYFTVVGYDIIKAILTLTI